MRTALIVFLLAAAGLFMWVAVEVADPAGHYLFAAITLTTAAMLDLTRPSDARQRNPRPHARRVRP
jgi:hypothetical protein